MSRITRQALRHLLDISVLSLSYVLAFLIRFDGDIPEQMLKRALFLFPYIIALRFLTLYLRGVHRMAWRYVSLEDVRRILGAIGLASAGIVAARLVAHLILDGNARAGYATIPFGVVAIDTVLSFLGVVGIRVLWRLRLERASRLRHQASENVRPIPTLLVGAGSAGVQVVREMGRHPDLNIEPVGFVDDDPNKRGSIISGVEVLGTIDKLAELAEKRGAEQVLITIASAPNKLIRKIVDACDGARLEVKIIPAISEIIDGRVEMNRIRNVSIEDLLGRDAISLDAELTEAFIGGRRIAVTGAGGSIGSELCRQIARLKPESLLLIERAEPSLFEIHRELTEAHEALHLVAAICDVCDKDRVTQLMEAHRPHVVFHAAAHKHVPLMEQNPGEAIKNNVFGTLGVAQTAAETGVDTFVMVSTDKAVNPTSIMGATKRVAEVVVQSMTGKSSTQFVAVRFGNVLGSAGSVIPIFKRQISEGGPVTVTHPEMTRYFMTIPEASQLVMQAGAMGEGGEIFVLDMGEPVRILDLAQDLIRLSGFEPDEDIPIQFSGVRPGEKLFEEIGFDAERMTRTRHPKIYIGKLEAVPSAELELGLERLRACLDATDRRQVMGALGVLVPELGNKPTPPQQAEEVA